MNEQSFETPQSTPSVDAESTRLDEIDASTKEKGADITQQEVAEAQDETVAALIRSAEDSKDPEALTQAIGAGVVEIATNSSFGESALDDTARELNDIPLEELGDALKKLEQEFGAHGSEVIGSVLTTLDSLNHHDNLPEAMVGENRGEAAAVEIKKSPASEAIDALNEMPLDGTHYEEIMKATELLKDESVDLQEKARLFSTLYAVEMQLASVTSSNDTEPKFSPEDIAVKKTIYAQLLLTQTPPKILKQMLALPDSDGAWINTICKKTLEAVPEKSRTSLEVRLQGYDSVYQKYIAAKYGLDTEGPTISTLEALGGAEDVRIIQKLSMDYLTNELGLPQSFSLDIYEALKGRARAPFSEKIDPSGGGAREELQKVSDILKEVGPEGVATLREKCGIVNVGELSKDQAHRMINFSEGDPALLEKLHQTEVCVILRDATSDWNGAFKGINQTYETTDGATLVFEISSMKNQAAELKSYIDKLRQNEIHPSAVVIAGHGLPGSIRIGDGDLLSIPHGVEEGVSVPLEKSGLTDLLSTMKADREGNCHVVFCSCSQAKPVPGVASEANTTLARAAELIQEKHPSNDAEYRLYGTAQESKLRVYNGALLDTSSSDAETVRIDVDEDGAIHNTRIKKADIPMFNPNRKKGDSHE